MAIQLYFLGSIHVHGKVTNEIESVTNVPVCSTRRVVKH